MANSVSPTLRHAICESCGAPIRSSGTDFGGWVTRISHLAPEQWGTDYAEHRLFCHGDLDGEPHQPLVMPDLTRPEEVAAWLTT